MVVAWAHKEVYCINLKKKGVITVEKNGKSIDDIFLIAAENGVDDIEDAGQEVLLYTKPEDVTKVKDALSENGLAIKTFELIFRPIVINAISDSSAAEKALSFIDKLESLDDVQRVYANFDIPDELIEDNK